MQHTRILKGREVKFTPTRFGRCLDAIEKDVSTALPRHVSDQQTMILPSRDSRCCPTSIGTTPVGIEPLKIKHTRQVCTARAIIYDQPGIAILFDDLLRDFNQNSNLLRV